MTPSKGSKELGGRIRQLREAKRDKDPANFSGRQFSIFLEISPTYLSKIETGELPASAELLKKMAARLDTDVDDLLALANKFDPELEDIIMEKPKVMATFLRTASGMTQDQLSKVQSYMNFVQRENDDSTSGGEK
ncbi:MAG: helix-turn-helix transcriptional regulator [Evtepia sp.]